MGRFRLFAAFAVFWMAAVALGAARGGFVPWFLAGSLGFLLLYALLIPALCLRGAGGTISVSSERAIAGEKVEVKVELCLAGWIPLPWLSVRGVWTDAAGRMRYRSTRLLFPGRRRSVGCRYIIRDLDRGVFRHERVELTTGDLFGLLTVTKRLPLEAELTALPFPLAPPPLPEWGGAGGASLPENRMPAGPEPSSGIREYQPGDPLRLIHWLATARTGSLKSVDSEPEHPDRVFVLLDGRHADRFETEVGAAAGLLIQAASQGAWTAFFCNAGLPPAASGLRTAGYSPGQVKELLEVLAALREPDADTGADADAGAGAGAGAGDSEAFAEFVRRKARELPAGSTVFLVTANPDEKLALSCAELARSNRKAAVIHVRAELAEGETPDPEDGRREKWFARSGCSYGAVYHSGGKGGARHGRIA